MKMSPALYSDLQSDMIAVAKRQREKGHLPEFVQKDMWNLFHMVMFDRNNDDNHPSYSAKEGRRVRVLPFWSRNGESKDMQGNDTWLNRFYNEEDLNDSHIETALKKIYNLKVKYL